MVIYLFNGKGGSGKTLLSFLLASAFSEAGKRVAIRDLDFSATGSASDYISNLKRNSNTKVRLEEKGTAYDILFLDTEGHLNDKAGHIVEEVKDCLAQSDIILFPTSPSLGEVWGLKRTISVVTPYLPSGASPAMFFNRVKQNTRVAHGIESIKQSINIRSLESKISDSTSYQEVPVAGWKSLPKRYKYEIQQLAMEIALL